ncbi:ATP12 family protein [Pseudoroseomonas globiformis]|uniref:ATP12 family protein n=1 Tax=Teichococcus globiformis TaxID=2307229 RepID=A0ABV7G5F2_9PROT
MKRFWDQATVSTVDSAGGGGFTVLLDGRPMRLPGSGILHLPGRALAEAVAEEWQLAGGGKGGEMRLEEVPLTRVAATAMERIAPDPAPSAEAIASYGGTDLLCYRATEAPLAARQAAEWQPLLDWLAQACAAPLRVTEGIMPVAQDSAALAALAQAVAAHPPLELAALGVAVPALGSLALGLALSRGRINAAEACRLAFLDESYQQELWGRDEEAAQRQENVERDVHLAARLLTLARQ